MYPHGVVYQSGKSKSHSEFILRPKFLVKLSFNLLRSLGFGFVSFAIAGILFTYWPVIKDEISYKFRKNEQISGFGELVSKALAEDADRIKKEASSLNLDPYFSLHIPKIGAKSNVIPNVDAGNYEEYNRALKEGIAHAKGTNFPGQGEGIYLFSHSTDSLANFNRYNAVFYLLGKLEEGDRIYVYFLNRKHVYKVTKKVIAEAKDISWFNHNSGKEELVLQTCDPPGTSLRRLLIIAEPIY